MNVYMLRADVDRYQSLVLVRDQEWAGLLENFDGQPLATRWSPVDVEVVDDVSFSRQLPPSDFPSLLAPHIPVFSEAAITALRDFLDGNGEILPLKCSEGTYFVFNVTRVVDVLDVEHSQFQRLASGRILDITSHEFHADRVDALTIFKLPQLHRSYVYVTDPFVQRVRERGLTGFAPRLVWSGHAK